MGAGVILFVLFFIMLLLGCVMATNRPVRICEPYIVGKGETLWTIADKFASGDKRDWICEVQDINDIEGSIYAGETIYVFSEWEE